MLKKIARVLFPSILLSLTFTVATAFSATCYWVGQASPNDAWTDSDNWSSSSGGSGATCAGSGGIPGSADTAVFDSGSSESPVISGAISLASLSMTGDFLGKVDMVSYGFSASGNLSLAGGHFYAGNGANTYIGGTTTQTGGNFYGGSAVKITHAGRFDMDGGNYYGGTAGEIEFNGLFDMTNGYFDGETVDLLDFNGGESISTKYHSFLMSGGTFNMPETGKEMTMRASFNISAGGDFVDKGGTLNFDASSYPTYVNLNVSKTIQNVKISKPNTGNTYEYFYIEANDTLTVSGTLTLTSGRFVSLTNAKLVSTGSVIWGENFNNGGGDGHLSFEGTGNNDFTLPDGAKMPRVTIDNPNMDIITSGMAQVNVYGAFLLANGSFANSADVNVSFSGTYQQTGGNFYAGAPAMITHTGRVDFDGGIYYGETADEIRFNHLFDMTAGYFDGRTVDLLNFNGTVYVSLRYYSFTMSGGTFDAPTTDKIIRIRRLFSQTGGDYYHNYGKILFSGNETGMVTTTGGTSFYDVEINKTAGVGSNDDFELLSGLDINRNLTCTAGEFKTSNNTVNIAGNWSRTTSCYYVPGTTVFTMDGSDQYIYGSTSFGSFSKTTNSTLYFEAGETQTFSGTLTLQGESASNRLNLRSTSTDLNPENREWYIVSTGAKNLAYLDVADSNASGGNTILVGGTGSFDSGYNTDWDFGATIVNQILKSTSGHFRVTDDIFVDYSINGGTHARINWYKNNQSITLINMPFEGNNGDEATQTKDISGNAYHSSVINQAIWYPTGGHDSRGAYYFDGSNDYIRIDDSDTENPIVSGNQLSVCAWVYPLEASGQGSTNDRIISKEWASDVAPWYAWAIRRSSSTETYAFVLYEQSGALIGNSGGTVPPNQWNHICGVYDSEQVIFYINGVGQTPAVASGNNFAENTRPIQISGNYYGREYPKLYLDEILILNHGLSEDQVVSLYNSDFETITASETTAGDLWKAQIFPYNSSSGSTGPGEYTDNYEIFEEGHIIPEFGKKSVIFMLLAGVIFFGWNVLKRKTSIIAVKNTNKQ